MGRLKVLTGQVFGKRTVLRKENKGPGAHWLVRCECGVTAVVPGTTLLRGAGRSCLKCRDYSSRVLPDAGGSFNKVFSTYRTGARDRGHDFELTKEQVREITSGPCYYCGAVATNAGYCQSPRAENYKYNGLDRLDNTKGYTLANSVSCCFQHNRAKADRNAVEFIRDGLVVFIHRLVGDALGVSQESYHGNR